MKKKSNIGVRTRQSRGLRLRRNAEQLGRGVVNFKQEPDEDILEAHGCDESNVKVEMEENGEAALAFNEIDIEEVKQEYEEEEEETADTQPPADEEEPCLQRPEFIPISVKNELMEEDEGQEEVYDSEEVLGWHPPSFAPFEEGNQGQVQVAGLGPHGLTVQRLNAPRDPIAVVDRLNPFRDPLAAATTAGGDVVPSSTFSSQGYENDHSRESIEGVEVSEGRTDHAYYRSALGNMRFVCYKCLTEFKYRHQLASHKCSTVTDQRYICPGCSAEFASEHWLNSHACPRTSIIYLRMASEEQGATAGNATSGVIRFPARRGRPKKHATEDAPPMSSPPSIQQLQNELLGPRYTCKLCLKGFDSRSEYNGHIQMHLYEMKEKQRLDEITREQFADLMDSINQEETFEQPLYLCSYCEKEFSTVIERSRHWQRHQCLRRYLCEGCSNGFATECELRRHIAFSCK